MSDGWRIAAQSSTHFFRRSFEVVPLMVVS
jgi:hypothetical protein